MTHSQSILLVEDNQDDYEATCRAFKKANLSQPHRLCKSCRDAVDYLRPEGAYKSTSESFRPGLVLLDLNMPCMYGRKTLEVIKSRRTLKQIPVIILTTSADERDIQACYQPAPTPMYKARQFRRIDRGDQRLTAYWFEIALLPKKPAMS